MIVLDDTIVAIATPLGVGGLGVIRLSGPRALLIADSIFQRTHRVETSLRKLSGEVSHTLHHGRVVSEEDSVDEAVAGIFLKPHSYTGEDVIEISCHGSPEVLKEILRLTQQKGARLARPGEFTERAFLNGKMDLAQAEAVADLIHARSKGARRQALDQLAGVLSSRIRRVRGNIMGLLAGIEANLDFAEEDIQPVEKKDMERTLQLTEQDLAGLLTTSLRGKLLRDGARVVILGRPNAGKSSLFNALLAFDRAIVTDIPGTTRDTIEEELDWQGFSISLIDTAGLREAKDPIEAMGIERTERAKSVADIFLLLIDASLPLSKEDEDILNNLEPEKTIVVLTKVDQGILKENISVGLRTKIGHVIETSSMRETGLLDLENAVVQLLTVQAPVTDGSPVLANERHVHHVEAALEKVRAALQALKAHQTEEAVSIEIRGAAQELGLITGQDASDDLLEAIFSKFCIGK